MTSQTQQIGRRTFAGCAIAAALFVCCLSVRGADAVNAAEKQRQLLDVLRSNADPGEKAVTCKFLAVYGTDEAVPILAPLLADERLASWARIALEAIPGAAADAALRQAMGQVQGKLLVGVINSIGVRGDAGATSGLVTKLGDGDAEVASAAAVALGRVGGPEAAAALQRALTKAPAVVRSAVAEGCIRCAEKLLGEGKRAEALVLYQDVRKAEVPKQAILDATRGVILARGTEGIPLLLEQLRSPDKAHLAIGLSTARELSGSQITEALTAEIRQASRERQPLLLLALADRNDPSAMPTIVEAARSGSKQMKRVAISVLDRLGQPSSLPVLLEAATGGDADLSAVAMGAMLRLPGKEVDNDILARLNSAKGNTRAALIELAGQRNLEEAVPAIARSTQDPDPKVRSAALKALGNLGGEKQVGDLVKQLQASHSPNDREAAEAALLAICSRRGASCMPQLQTLAKSKESDLRMVALRAFAAAGGPEALAALQVATNDKDEVVQDEAVRTLSTWPNTWPEDDSVAEPLLELANSAKKTNHQVLALRGYLQYLQSNRKLNADSKVSKLKEAVPLLKRPEEKQLAIAVLSGTRSASSLELLGSFAAEPAVADDACAAIVQIAARDVPGASKEVRQKALQTALDKATNENTKKRAQSALARIR